MRSTIKMQLLSLEEKGIHLMIGITVNGKSARFLIDTGASQTVMDKKRAEEFLDDATVEESETLSKGLGTDSMKSFTATIKSMEFGNLTLPDQEVVLLDLSHVNNSYMDIGEDPIDGVLGGDIMTLHKAVIDYGEQTICLQY